MSGGAYGSSLRTPRRFSCQSRSGIRPHGSPCPRTDLPVRGSRCLLVGVSFDPVPVAVIAATAFVFVPGGALADFLGIPLGGGISLIPDVCCDGFECGAGVHAGGDLDRVAVCHVAPGVMRELVTEHGCCVAGGCGLVDEVVGVHASPTSRPS